MICRTCGIAKDEESFAWRNQAKGTRQSKCKDCKNAYNKDWYADNRDEHIVNAMRNKEEAIARLRVISDAAKSVPCADCGLTFPPVAMDFDHLDATLKIDNVSTMIRNGFSEQKILDEIAKCEVVCACCHRIRTASRLGLMDKASPF